MWYIIDQPTGMASIGNLHKQLFISHKYLALTLRYTLCVDSFNRIHLH